jgi:hypothetical protein
VNLSVCVFISYAFPRHRTQSDTISSAPYRFVLKERRRKKPPSAHLHSPNPNRQPAIRFLQLHVKSGGAPAGQRQGTRMGGGRVRERKGKEGGGRYLGWRRKESRAGGVRRRDGAGAGAGRWSGGRVCQLVLLRPYRKGKGTGSTGVTPPAWGW